MTITFSQTSQQRLKGIHPDLERVVRRAALMAPPEHDFTVLEGVRSREQMCANYGKGRTESQCTARGVPASYAMPTLGKVTWLANPFASKHGVQADGYGHAVDLAPWPIDWHDLERFEALAALIKSAAHQENVQIIWGGDWRNSPDRPHFELAKVVKA